MDKLTHYKQVSVICLLIFATGQATHENILRSLNAKVNGSSQHSHQFALPHAVDGSTKTVSTCSCCAATVYQKDPWMMIDLGRLYRVSIIKVTGRTDATDSFEGMNIYLYKERQNRIAETVTIPKVTGNVPYYNRAFEDPVIARYITLQLTGNHLLLVCEVSVYSRDCHGGHYGASCDQTCGHCLGDEVCDHVTGTCTRCVDGYVGDLCKNVCPAGTFGRDCTSSCHCFNNKACDHVTGRCPDDRCDFGWHWSNCSKECHAGRFGENCQEYCGSCLDNVPCEKRDGNCTSCSIGYIGQQCKQVCQPGRYGHKCSLKCGLCADGLCDIVTGVCLEGCLPGYQGRFCQKYYNVMREPSIKLSMSSTYQGLDAYKAVDGRYEGIPRDCRCCSETEHGGNSWWQAGFGTPKFIKQINIFGRIDENVVRHLTGFQIFVSLSGVFSEEPVYVHETKLQDNNVSVALHDVVAKFVRIKRAGILSICEVEVLLSGIRCPKSTYGHSCTPCGYCKNGTCEQVTGHCPGGCDENFEGDMCLTMKARLSAVVGGLIGMAILIVLGLVIVGVVFLIRWRKRVTTYDAPKASWNRNQLEDYSSLDLPAYHVQH